MGQSFNVTAKEAGERLDKYLCRKLPNFSRKQIKALLDGGRVSVGRHRVVIAGWELTEDDQVEVRIPPGFHERSETDREETGRTRSERPRAHSRHSEKIGASIDRFLERQKRRRARPPEERGEKKEGRRRGKGRERGKGDRERLKVYYQDRDVIVVEKPAGVLSVPKDGGKARGTLKQMIASYMKRKHKGSRHSFIAPLHRLDAETSGVMVFALSKAGQKLSRQFKNHTIQRTYQAVVEGRIEKENGVIDRPLEKGEFGHGKKARPAKGGRSAVTEYTVRERYKGATLLDVRVRTGRTHQIRVHLASEGFPVVGDSLYDKEHRRSKGDEIGFGRHALHAHHLAFKHPVSGKKISYRSPLPADMRQLIDRLRETV